MQIQIHSKKADLIQLWIWICPPLLVIVLRHKQGPDQGFDQFQFQKILVGLVGCRCAAVDLRGHGKRIIQAI